MSDNTSDPLRSRRHRKKRKEKSLNHLLNFSLPDRTPVGPSPHIVARPSPVQYKPYRREKFVNANFRFLLKPSGNYTFHDSNPDAVFDWNAIEQVVIHESQSAGCPICLSEPTAGRVARCGHTFCLPCILRYFELGENNCPICGYDIEGVSDLKSLKILPCACDIKPGTTMRFTLMHRKGGSMLALPAERDNEEEKIDQEIPWNDTPFAMDFARYMLAHPKYVRNEYEREARELSASLQRLELDSKATGGSGGAEQDDMASIAASLAVLDELKRDIPQDGHRASYRPNSSRIGPNGHNSNNAAAAADYYFYQAADGRPVFLEPRCIKILKYAFGDYRDFPPSIENIVNECVEETLTEESRKRKKYLGHLSIGCTVSFVDIDLQGIVSKEILDAFPKPTVEATPNPTEPEKKEEEKDDTADVPLIDESQFSDEEALLEYVLKVSAQESGRHLHESTEADVTEEHIDDTRNNVHEDDYDTGSWSDDEAFYYYEERSRTRTFRR